MFSTSVNRASQGLCYKISDFENCIDEPIAFCGAIQNAGLMIIARAPDFLIEAASANWSKTAHGYSALDLQNKSVTDLFDIEGLSCLAEDVLGKRPSDGIFKVRGKHSQFNTLETGFCYRQHELLIIEFDLTIHASESATMGHIKDLVHRLKISDSVETACQKTVTLVKQISGYDRVMIYRFDHEWDGEVIAEASVPDLTPYLGLKYPATDIPAQARHLFSQNKVRMIVDTKSEAVPLITTAVDRGEFNIGSSIFRAVSPIHLQYLENMGVRATFAAPIKLNDKLWGLITCHHYSGLKHPSYEIRASFELVAQILSGKISDLLTRRRLESKTQSLELVQKFLADVAKGKNALDSFESSVETLLSMTSSASVVIKMGSDLRILGSPVNQRTLDSLLLRLRREDSLRTWRSDSLKTELGLGDIDPGAAGALAVPLALGFEDLLVWIRPEEALEIKWGGELSEKPTPNTVGRAKLTPRSSFEAWSEKVRGKSRPWSDADEECGQYLLFGFVQGIFAQAQTLALAYKELERAAKAKDIFIGTVSHELRTPLGIIIGWIDILKDIPESNAEKLEAIEIIDRNAKSQVALINDLLDVSRIISGKLRIEPVDDVALTGLISDILSGLKPSISAKNLHVIWDATNPVTMTADVDRLRQILWNLINNAVKFTPKNGQIAVAVKISPTSLAIEVSDNGIGIDSDQLNAVFETFSQQNASAQRSGGLGLGLSIVKSLVELHGGRVEAYSRGKDQGSKFTLHFPRVYRRVENDPTTEITQASPSSGLKQLEGIEIMIVEDQPDALRALQILLEKNGARVTTATNGALALKILKREQFDLLLSDIDMPGKDGYELMREWRAEERKHARTTLPAIALTAFASAQSRINVLASGFQSHIPKPIDKLELFAVIESLCIRPRSHRST